MQSDKMLIIKKLSTKELKKSKELDFLMEQVGVFTHNFPKASTCSDGIHDWLGKLRDEAFAFYEQYYETDWEQSDEPWEEVSIQWIEERYFFQ